MHAWLALLAARYNQAMSDTGNPVSSIDIDFSQCPQLQMLPQLVFALLRSPLLRLHEEGVHPDYRIYLQCLFRCVLFKILCTGFSLSLACNFSCTKCYPEEFLIVLRKILCGGYQMLNQRVFCYLKEMLFGIWLFIILQNKCLNTFTSLEFIPLK